MRKVWNPESKCNVWQRDRLENFLLALRCLTIECTWSYKAKFSISDCSSQDDEGPYRGKFIGKLNSYHHQVQTWVLFVEVNKFVFIIMYHQISKHNLISDISAYYHRHKLQHNWIIIFETAGFWRRVCGGWVDAATGGLELRWDGWWHVFLGWGFWKAWSPGIHCARPAWQVSNIFLFLTHYLLFPSLSTTTELSCHTANV